MPWPAPCSWTLPTLCTIEVAALLAFVEEAIIQDAPGRWSHMCTRYCRGKHWDHSSRGRAATCLHEKTRLARGHGSFSLGTYDAQTSCIPLKRSQDGMLLRAGMGDSTCAPGAYPVQTTNHRPQNPSGILFTVHIGVSRGPQAPWPSCLRRQNINHYTGHATDICPW